MLKSGSYVCLRGVSSGQDTDNTPGPLSNAHGARHPQGGWGGNLGVRCVMACIGNHRREHFPTVYPSAPCTRGVLRAFVALGFRNRS